MKRYQQFINECSVDVKRDIKLSRYCTFKIGGPADLFVDIHNVQDLITTIQLAKKLGINYLVLAGGSNLLFDDKGFRGLIVHFMADDIAINGKKMIVNVEAGYSLNNLIKYLANHNFGGMNFLANIPGSVGGAIVGNAGCYGQEISSLLVDVILFDTKKNKTLKVRPKELDFSYRDSELKRASNLIVLSATLKLIKVKSSNVLKDITKEKQLRLTKHPQAPSAGSFFKNPQRQAAWRFIDTAGMRGTTVGGARVSNKHSNFIVNYNKATAKDVGRLVKRVQEAVENKVGIVLEPEVRPIDQNGDYL